MTITATETPRYAHITKHTRGYVLLINNSMRPITTEWHVELGKQSNLTKSECRTMARDWRALPWNF